MQDFSMADMDIRPVSDPTTVTKMQQMARAQYLLGTVELLQAAGGDIREALRRSYEAADVDDIDKLLPEPQPNPMQEMAAQMEMDNKAADTEEKRAKAVKAYADAQAKGAETVLSNERLELEALKVGADVTGA